MWCKQHVAVSLKWHLARNLLSFSRFLSSRNFKPAHHCRWKLSSLLLSPSFNKFIFVSFVMQVIVCIPSPTYHQACIASGHLRKERERERENIGLYNKDEVWTTSFKTWDVPLKISVKLGGRGGIIYLFLHNTYPCCTGYCSTDTFRLICRFNPLNTKRRPLYLKTQFVPRSKHFSSRL